MSKPSKKAAFDPVVARAVAERLEKAVERMRGGPKVEVAIARREPRRPPTHKPAPDGAGTRAQPREVEQAVSQPQGPSSLSIAPTHTAKEVASGKPRPLDAFFEPFSDDILKMYRSGTSITVICVWLAQAPRFAVAEPHQVRNWIKRETKHLKGRADWTEVNTAGQAQPTDAQAIANGNLPHQPCEPSPSNATLVQRLCSPNVVYFMHPVVKIILSSRRLGAHVVGSELAKHVNGTTEEVIAAAWALWTTDHPTAGSDIRFFLHPRFRIGHALATAAIRRGWYTGDRELRDLKTASYPHPCKREQEAKVRAAIREALKGLRRDHDLAGITASQLMHVVLEACGKEAVELLQQQSRAPKATVLHRLSIAAITGLGAGELVKLRRLTLSETDGEVRLQRDDSQARQRRESVVRGLSSGGMVSGISRTDASELDPITANQPGRQAPIAVSPITLN